MAVLQISKIQVRRGQKSQTGIPTLSAGEFAWAVDAQELYIGNGAVSEGSPAVGNTRLLTELDANNIFKLASTYIYRDYDGSPIQTGADVNDPTRRTLQEKLDDYVSLSDFGTAGDGITNDTKSFQAAVDQTFLNTAEKGNSRDHRNRKKLRIPAGTYLITGTIYIPSYATLEGDGIDRVVIKQDSSSTAIFQTIDFGSTPTNKILYPNIASGLSHQPRLIEVSGMTLQYTAASRQGTGPMIAVDCVKDLKLSKIKMIGLGAEPTDDTQQGILLRGEGALTTQDVQIENCHFENINIAIQSDFDVEDINVFNTEFKTLYRGIEFNTALTDITPKKYGPRRVKVKDSKFTDIHSEAVAIAPNASNESTKFTSEGNSYDNIGNELSNDGDQTQLHPVLSFGTPGNQSINDKFSRTVANNSGTPGRAVAEILGHGRLTTNIASSQSLAVVSFNQPILTVSKLPGFDQTISIDYVAQQPSINNTRAGKLQILAGNYTATIYDSYQYAGANNLINNLEFFVSLNTATYYLEVSAYNPVGSVVTNLTYSYNILF
jgi:hypothetical protein